MREDLDRRRFFSLLGQGVTTGCLVGTLSACGRGDDVKSYDDPSPAPLPTDSPNSVELSGKPPQDPTRARPTRDLILSDTVFSESVASGDPTPNGVILWTRINPDHVLVDVPLEMQVARDLAFQDLVFEGEVPGAELNDFRDFTAKVDLHPHLEPLSTYFYRFIYGNNVSRTGRCRTLPAPNARLEKLRLAYLSCQDFSNGYYPAFSDLANRRDIDFVLHLGDFIYETVGDKRFQFGQDSDRMFTLPSEQTAAMDLRDYRFIYRKYRSDDRLKRFLETHTLIMVPDDHEIANDYYWDYDRELPGIPDHPFQKDPQYQPADQIKLRMNAVRAWYEYTPTRVDYDPQTNDPFRVIRLYRDFNFGNLVHLFMIDCRSYRSAPACGTRDLFGRYLPVFCKDYRNEDMTMLGFKQKEWLFNNFYQTRSRWSVLGNQVLMGQLNVSLFPGTRIPVSLDAWDGYTKERQLLAQHAKQARLDNLVVLTGDMHTSIASHIKMDYRKSENFDLDNTVGVEFMTPSITSSTLVEQLENRFKSGLISSNFAERIADKVIQRLNPHIQCFNTREHGYSTIEFNHRFCEWTSWAVNKGKLDNAAVPIHRYRKYNLVPRLEELAT